MAKQIEIQGHRGCRGLLPENTITAFKKAVDLGVDVLEMDVVLSDQHEVVVSHDPYMRSNVMAHLDGQSISADDEMDLNLYKMPWSEAKEYKSDLAPHPHFPEQNRLPLAKPLLIEVASAISYYCDQNGYPLPGLNIEIKSRPEWDNVYHPDILHYADAVVKGVENLQWKGEVTLQSFDTRMIKELNRIAPHLPLFYLADENTENPKACFEKLGFKTYGFSPHFSTVNEHVVWECKELNMSLVVWTVNDLEEAKRLAALGVNGIITDYPDRINRKSVTE